ncbi:MAG: hypothetical protein PWR25_502 [Euryarchaeota archaeon]|nr:hypothetical protein [Euryarchaeota archaeon]
MRLRHPRARRATGRAVFGSLNETGCRAAYTSAVM